MTDRRTVTVLRKLIVDTVNADPHAAWGCLDDEVAERVAEAVLGHLPDVAEVTTEWGTRWIGDPESDVEEWGDDEEATRRIARQYGDATVVQREVRRGPWTAAS